MYLRSLSAYTPGVLVRFRVSAVTAGVTTAGGQHRSSCCHHQRDLDVLHIGLLQLSMEVMSRAAGGLACPRIHIMLKKLKIKSLRFHSGEENTGLASSTPFARLWCANRAPQTPGGYGRN